MYASSNSNNNYYTCNSNNNDSIIIIMIIAVILRVFLSNILIWQFDSINNDNDGLITSTIHTSQ